jgi:hypothetical protein
MTDTLHSRHRTAWLILLGSFCVCAAMAVATPLMLNSYVRTATRPMEIVAVANQGTVGIYHAETDTRAALFAGDPTLDVAVGSQILTNATDSALLVFYAPGRENVLARLLVYGNSNLTLEEADAPRFGAGSVDERVRVTLASGRARLTIPGENGGGARVTMETPQGQVEVAEPGLYSIIVSNAATDLAVQEGAAAIRAAGETLALSADQRGVVNAAAAPMGPLPTERNLLRNADFSAGLDGWIALDWNVELTDQPQGELIVENRLGEPSLVMHRDGVGHADVGVRQLVEADVTDFRELKLVLGLRIQWHSLPVCGNRGSECPVTVSIEYEDANGIVREWRQGFYALGQFAFDAPDLCVSCPPPRSQHVHVTSGQVNFYESDNLLEKLAQQDIEARAIRNVSIFGAGHAFDVEIVDVALLGLE